MSSLPYHAVPMRRTRLPVVAALTAVYLVWGSTYLALRFMVDGFPPLLGNAIRMTVAGGLLYPWLRLRGAAAPTRRQWGYGFAVGTALFLGGVGLVTIAEDVGVGSGVTATAVAMVPVWAALISGFFGQWPTRREWVGLAIGLAGVVLLSREGDFQGAPLGLFLIVISPIFWAFGSVWSKYVDLPDGLMSSTVQMIGGGVVLAVTGFAFGERLPASPSAASVIALIYLIGAGSIVAFTAYAYLLRTVPAPLATSYAYVNPVVAVILGITIGAEQVTGQVWLALPIILTAVALIARRR